MASGLQGTISSLAHYARTIAAGRVQYDEIYNQNCHRVYSLAFWMTGNELAAEQLSANTFLRAFASTAEPTTDHVDRAFLTEVRELGPLGTLTLSCDAIDGKSIYGNIKRIHLEQAVLALPQTEKLIFLLHDVEGYEHSKIAFLLGITETESQNGLHQARVHVRNSVSKML
jgi:RNA polymerase sigma-70 factor (ECF subfamily)